MIAILHSDTDGCVHWSPVEDRLYFSDWRLDKMYTATFSTENGVFEPALPEVLFDLGVSSQIASRFGLSPAGKRFIVLAPADKESQSDPANPRVMVNWFEELKSKTPENKNE